MTLVIAFKTVAPGENGGEAVVMSSDSRATMGGLASFRTKKIYPINVRTHDNKELPLALVGSSGDFALIKNVIEIIERRFREKFFGNWNNGRPSYDQFGEAIHNVEQEIINRLRSLRECDIRPEIGLIIAGVDNEGKASLWEMDERGLMRKVDDFPGYVSIGMGFILGGNLLLQMFHDITLQFDVTRGALFSAFIINQVSRNDPSVGPYEGESIFFDKNGLHHASANSTPRIQAETTKIEQMLRKLFISISPFKAEQLDKDIEEGLKLLDEKRKLEKEKLPQGAKED
jgi:hypothetical protein